MTDKDFVYPIGEACLDYLSGNKKAEIVVQSNIAEDDEIPVDYLFRNYLEMPELEKVAMLHCSGKILEVGAGAGSHSLYLQTQKKNVHAIDIDPKVCQVMKLRGVDSVACADFYNLDDFKTYDTILLLMNGIGIAKKIDLLSEFFHQVDRILKPGGKVIFDSSDLRYLFAEDDGSMLINLNDQYYGEVTYRMKYQDKEGAAFDWLFIDDESMRFHADKNGFVLNKIFDGPHYDYLASLTRK